MWIRDKQLDTTFVRAATGLVVGSATGTILTLLGFIAITLQSGQGLAAVWQGVPSGLFLAIPIFIVWMLGAFTVGALGWAVLHGLGVRTILAAALYGGAVTFLVATGLTGGQAPAVAAPIGVAGVVAGLAIWGFSYRLREETRAGEVFA